MLYWNGHWLDSFYQIWIFCGLSTLFCSLLFPYQEQMALKWSNSIILDHLLTTWMYILGNFMYSISNHTKGFVKLFCLWKMCMFVVRRSSMSGNSTIMNQMLAGLIIDFLCLIVCMIHLDWCMDISNNLLSQEKCGIIHTSIFVSS